MRSFERIEDELRRREPGWWTRLVQAIPELGDLSGTPQPSKYHASRYSWSCSGSTRLRPTETGGVCYHMGFIGV